MGFLLAGYLHVEGFQWREAIELNCAVAGGVGTGRQPVQTITDGQVQRQAVLVVFVHDVGAIFYPMVDVTFFLCDSSSHHKESVKKKTFVSLL